MAERFALARFDRQRRRLTAGAVVLTVLAAAALGLAVAGTGGGRTWIGKVSLALVAAGLVALAALLLRAARAPVGHLEVTSDGIVIEHPALLREPLVLSRAELRTVLVDAGESSAAGGASPELLPRFPLVETDEPAWLHPGARTAMPVLGWERATPNVAIVLRGAYVLDRRPRRLLAFLEGNEPLRALATCAGFFLCVDDPARLADVLARAELDPPLTLAEAEVLDQRARDRRRGQRS